MSNSSIAVVGLGYIGLPTAVVLADAGHTVVGVDISQRNVTAVNEGRLPFVEPALGDRLEAVVKAGRLTAQHETPAAQVYIVAVPTPFKEGHAADLSHIEAAADGIAPQLSGGELVILESTSPPGATGAMAARIRAARPELDDVMYAHCPERVLPGRIMEELVTNDRVIGGLTPRAAEAARDVYASFCRGELHLTDATTAEMAKLTENAFRDVNIAFANELSLISDRLGIDVWELIQLANKHPRVNILQPGPGVGGHCIAVDPWFIVSSTPEEAQLIRTAREVNDGKPSWVIEKVKALVADNPSPRIGVLGLSFKANIDDLRESPAVWITARLADAFPQGRILAVEPHIEELPESLAQRSQVELTHLEDTSDCDVWLLLVDHQQFAVRPTHIDPERLLDTRGLWRAQQ